MEGLRFYFSRTFGLSSEGLFREAMGLPEARGFFPQRPYDAGDLEGAEATYDLAPDWMRERMRPRLEWYREIARTGFPDELPRRAA